MPEYKAELYPPCQVACPVHTDVQRYVAMIAQERYEEALQAIMENNPLPSVCGRICAHPCEEVCRRQYVDQAIAIRALKRFVTDQVGYWKSTREQPVPKTKSKKVAVIGSGPSGLTAAHDLAKLSYEVTIFEKQPEPGGMLRHGILRYRLPADVLQGDIDNILALGVELKTNSPIGDGLSLDQLRRDYDAVLVAVGLSASHGLAMPGAEAEGVHLAVPFLESVNYGRPEPLGDNVIVIGGGNVAVDVARSARRLGDKKVTMVCLESREEMPAHEWEIDDALNEGIQIHCSLGPHRIVTRDGRAAGLEFKEVKCVFDEEGRFNPQFYEDRRSVLEGDTVILAIGQAGDVSFVGEAGLALNERGQLVFDRQTMRTSDLKVFASGEIVTGPGAAINAIASGHRAAKAIDAYLEGRPLVSEPELKPIDVLPDDVAGKIYPSRRQVVSMVEAEKRIASFDEVELGYGQEAASREAQRCLSCAAGARVDAAKCAACLTCVRICPYDVPVIEGQIAYMDPQRCQSCGFCAAECPARAINVPLTEDELVAQQIERFGGELAKAGGVKTIGFVCLFGHIWAADRTYDIMPELPDNVRIVEVLCPGRLEPLHFLKAFEAGADRVFVSICGSNYCHYGPGNDLTERRLERLRGLLDAVGVGRDKLVTYTIDGQTKLRDIVENKEILR